jgi:hypothetical protein
VAANFPITHPRQAEQAAPSRLSNGRWAKGTSGNPSGHPSSLVEPSKRKQATLFAAIVDDFGGELSPLHQEYAALASRQLVRAARSKDDAIRRGSAIPQPSCSISSGKDASARR